ncbi:hypothetical protein IQ254_29095, partial [Nodosilinea sp. LEGE 07088]|uniref:hypothetical protein n=1 Tax=Nodosilinea sp. LEGE 07088 TaxID=2777968 RepID=UPI0018826BF0
SSPPHLLTAVQTQATAAREALNPRILERIPRKVVREKYLGAIARGTHEQKERLIAIIGPAGYGKSTILGDIYDELLAAETPWVGLVLCSSLSLSTSFRGFVSYGLVASTMAGAMPSGPSQNQQEMIAIALGQSLCGDMHSVVEACQELNQILGRGVLLIDTLDLVINRDFVVAFGALMRQVLAAGTTVAFTCRDHEYNDYLEPVNLRLPGLSQAADRYAVPNFSTAEIRAAAVAFFRTLAPEQPERGQAFADKVLALSTDNRSLRDILESPLLLALLCDLFGEAGDVPPDLTVSKLYQRYWQEKVAYSRIDQSHYAPLAMEKEAFCLGVAQRLFELSESRLCESFYRDDLGLSFTPAVLAAYNDLLSEGVLTPLGSGKVHFFHQTLLEYAIAYWLTRQSATAQRHQFFEQLQQPETLTQRTHWLPVLRQFLAIAEEAEFETWVAQLDLNAMGIFGAVAYAAVSRDRPDALRRLLPTALHLGEHHQRRLRHAIAAAPRLLIENTWDVLLTLLQEADHRTAGNTAQMVGGLLERWWSALRQRLPETLAVVARRPPTEHPKFPEGYDDRVQLLGWLLQPSLPLIQANPEEALLAALREQVDLVGHGTAAGIVQCHQTATPAAQRDLLQRLLAHPVPRYEDIRDALGEFVSGMLPDHVALGQFPLGQTWAEILHHPAPAQWDKVQIKAVGRWAAKDDAIFYALMEDYLCGPADRISRNLKALTESIQQGAGTWVWAYLRSYSPDTSPPLYLERLPRLVPPSAAGLYSAEVQEAIAQWLRPHLSAQAEPLAPLLNMLADASPTARKFLEESLPHLSPALRHEMTHQMLRFQPLETHPPLYQFSGKDQKFLVTLYRQQARYNPAALAKLLDAALSTSNDAAVAASQDLAKVGGDSLTVANLLPLVQSRFVGVRANGLVAITTLNQRAIVVDAASTDLNETTLGEICTILANEANPTVVRHFCDLATNWVRHYHRVPVPIVGTLHTLLTRIARRGDLEGGLGRSLVVLLKAIARTEDSRLDVAQLDQVVQQLLMAIPMTQLKNGESEIIDVLCALHRLDPTVLPTLIDQMLPELLRLGWLRNAASIIKTARKLEGPQSPQLDIVMQRYGRDATVESLVLEARGI